MNIEAKISGPLEGYKNIFLVKGKYDGEEWNGLVKQVGKNARLTLVSSNISSAGKQRIVSYSGNVLAECAKFETGTKLKFEGVFLTLRVPRKEDAADMAKKVSEQEAIIKAQAEAQAKTNEMLEELLQKVAELEAKTEVNTADAKETE